MDLDPLHLDITRIVLEATVRYETALGGGNALLAHGISARRTEDIVMWAVGVSNLEVVSRGAATAPLWLSHGGRGVWACRGQSARKPAKSET